MRAAELEAHGDGMKHSSPPFRSSPSEAAAIVRRTMSERRQELNDALERYYRGCGFPVEHHEDGSLRARGVGGVTWIGLAVLPDDLDDSSFGERLLALADERMPAGERCPLELLPAEECADGLRVLLAELRLERRGHVEVYSLAA